MPIPEPRQIDLDRRPGFEQGQLESFLVESGPRADLDRSPDLVAELGQRRFRVGEQLLGDLWVDGDGDRPPSEPRQVFANFAQHPESDALRGQHVASSLAVGAGLAQRLDEVLPGALARHLDQSEFRDLENVGARLVGSQRILKCAIDLVAICGGLHVDQVDDDQTAEIAEAELMHDLGDSLEVRLEHCIFEVSLADETPRIDVDRRQRLALVHHERSPGLEPDLAFQICVDLAFEAKALEYRVPVLVVLDLRLRVGHETLDKVLDAVEYLLVVGHDAFGLVTGDIAHDAQREIVLRVEDRGRLLFLVAPLDGCPDRRQIADISLQIGLANSIARGANDEAEILRAQTLDDLPESAALPVGSDASRDADAPRPRCQHQMSTGDREARGDARALDPDRLLGDLDHDLFAFVEHRVDARRGRTAAAPAIVSAPPPRGFPFAFAGFELALEIVADVEERRLLEADIDEGRLHAGQDTAHAPLEDVADDALVSLALDVEFCELTLLEQRNPGFPELRVDYDLVLHRTARSAVRSGCPNKRARRVAPPPLASPIEGFLGDQSTRTARSLVCRVVRASQPASPSRDPVGVVEAGCTDQAVRAVKWVLAESRADP